MSAPSPSPADADTAQVAIIGAGLAGLALGIRLQAAGMDTLILEQQEDAGGCVGSLRRDSFVFELGPCTVPDLAPLEELWRLGGADLAADCEFLPLPPLVRFDWPDGRRLDLTGDTEGDRTAVAAFAPADLPAFEAWRSGARSWQLRPALRFRNSALRDALTSMGLLTDAAPARAQQIAALTGGWAVRGGTDRLIAALVRHYERLGGRLLLRHTVTALSRDPAGTCQIACSNGFSMKAASVVSSLGADNTRALLSTPRNSRRQLAPAIFTVHFALRGSWPGIGHHGLLMCDEHHASVRAVRDKGILPARSSIVLSHPSAVDPALAPVGHAVFRASTIVPNLRQAPLDWAAVGPQLERAILAETGQRLIPDLADRLVMAFHTTPADWANRLALPGGTPFGLREPARAAARGLPDNVVLIGAQAGAGAAIPDVLAGAERAASRLLGQLRSAGKG